MIKEMNDKIFKKHLLDAVEELKNCKGINGHTYKFYITPVVEEGKAMQAKDEFMRLNVLNPKFIDGKIFSEEEVILMLSHFSPLVPIWINVKYVTCEGDDILMNLECSLRFRKPSLLRNQDTGHAPFKVVN